MNLLLLTSFSIANLKSGLSVRVYELFNNLSKIQNLSVILLTPVKIPNLNCSSYFSHRAFSKRFEKISIIDDFNPFRIRKLIQIIKKYEIDIIQNETIYGFLNLLPLRKNNTPILIDEFDFSYQLAQEISRNYFIQKYTLWLEKLATRYSTHILTVSGKDKSKLSKFYNISPDKITVIPNGANIQRFKTLSHEKKLKLREKFGYQDKFILFFHGSPWHKPNRKAFKKILHLAPKLKQKIRNLQILLVGNPFTSYNSGYIQSFPPVDDLESYIAMADVAIVPITEGSGTRLKILDYLASGIPIVSTKKGAEGLELIDRQSILISNDTSTHFIERILELYHDVQLRQELGRNGRKIAEEIYDWKKIGNKLYKLYESILK